MQKTANYGLNKPDVTDYYDVVDQNSNMDVIDTKLKELESNTSITGLTNHIEDTNNPHGVTKDQVGLSDVPNVSTNDQTPTYIEATDNVTLSSGEKLSIAFGKIAKAITSLISHLTDNVRHITVEERTLWNAKIDSSGGTVNGSITAKELELSEGHLEMSGDISYIDFHFGGDMSGDFTTRIIEYSKGQIEIINGVDQGKRLLIYTDKLTGSNSVLHTGNSVPVVVSTTAPSDTTAVWIIPS